jgi:16S rRNA C967 or C1407 C5-methylase (RsmB/RsmF family)
MTGERHRVEIDIDDHCFEALEAEAERLGVDIAEIVQRATSAWLNDMCEGCVATVSVDVPH